MSDTRMSYEASLDFEEYMEQLRQDHAVLMPTAMTPYEDMTDDELIRVFGASDDPIVIELVRRVSHILIAKMAFGKLHKDRQEELDELQRTDEDEHCVEALKERVRELNDQIHAVHAELSATRRKLARAHKRSVLFQKRMGEAEKELAYERRGVERLETRTRRKLSI